VMVVYSGPTNPLMLGSKHQVKTSLVGPITWACKASEQSSILAY
jgi:hypothetical protein